MLLAAGATFWAARSSSIFGVDRIEVVGAPPEVARHVERATDDLHGRSLVAIDPDEVAARVRALPMVAGVSVDRAFPNTLRIRVAAERPVAVVRRAHDAWLVTGAARVVSEIDLGTERRLARLWVPKGVAIRVGGTLPARYVPATRALEAVQQEKLPRRVKGVRTTTEGLVLVLRRGPEIRLGEARDLGLKAAVAAAIIRLVSADIAYVDVSVPERPVAGP
jgi:cell division protein FtsQ